jgi:hypothetical protein
LWKYESFQVSNHRSIKNIPIGTCDDNIMTPMQNQHQDRLQMDSQSIKDGVVVIGGGIIGLSTDYSLALSLQEMAQNFTPDQLPAAQDHRGRIFRSAMPYRVNSSNHQTR